MVSITRGSAGLAWVLLALMAGGCAPSWTIFRQAYPNPFVRKTQFSLAPLLFEGQSLQMPPAQRQIWQENQARIAQRFMARLSSTDDFTIITIPYSRGDAFVLAPSLAFFEQGDTTNVILRMKILDSRGAVLDDAELVIRHEAALLGNSERLGEVAEELGEVAASYMRSRIRP